MNRTGKILFGLAFLLTTSAITHAQITNGGFESGLTGWSSAGTAAAAGTTGGQPPLEGTMQAVISTPQGGTVSQGSLETFLELPIGSLFAITPSGIGGGSAIKQIFSVPNGAMIQFLWDFLPNGSTTGNDNDTGFFTLHLAGSPGTFTVLSNTSMSGGSPTGYHSFTSGPLAAGTYLLGFCAYDAVGFGGNAQRPTLLIDNVQIIPEPATWVLLFVGGVGAFLVRYRNAA